MDLTKSRSGVADGEEQSWPWGLQSLFVVLAGSGSMRRVWICAWLLKAPAGQPGGLRGARARGGRCPERTKSHTDDQQITPSPFPLAPGDTPAVSAPSLDSPCFRNTKKGLSLWDTCSFLFLFLFFGVGFFF